MTKEKEIGLEASIERLESIVAKLEKGENTLEESISHFEEGLALGKNCRTILDKAELRIKRLVEVNEDGSMSTEDVDE